MMDAIQRLLPPDKRRHFLLLSIPEAHVSGIDSISFSTMKIVLSYGYHASRTAAFITMDEETGHSDIVLRPGADVTDLSHEIGHHVQNQMASESFSVVEEDWRRAGHISSEVLFACGLSMYSMTDAEEFFADLYSTWAMATPMYRRARGIVREQFPGTAGILDGLFE